MIREVSMVVRPFSIAARRANARLLCLSLVGFVASSYRASSGGVDVKEKLKNRPGNATSLVHADTRSLKEETVTALGFSAELAKNPTIPVFGIEGLSVFIFLGWIEVFLLTIGTGLDQSLIYFEPHTAPAHSSAHLLGSRLIQRCDAPLEVFPVRRADES